MRPALLLAALFALPAAHAAEFEIANRDEAALIRALQEAARSAGPHHIRLHANGLYTLGHTDSEGLALPPIRSHVVIHGRGAEIRSWSSRPMHFLHVAKGGRASISALTLAEASNGVLRNEGQLLLDGVVISDSRSRGDNPIIRNEGQLHLRHSRIEYNLVHSAVDDATLLRNAGELRLEESLINGNRISLSVERPLRASTVLNLGALHTESVSLTDNLIDNLLGGVELQAVINAPNGRLSGSLQTAR